MTTPLLKTKLYIPPARPELVSRQRLIERLNAGLRRKLALISAPAGFGKTTLLAEWVHTVGVRHDVSMWVAWLSLDEGDNDPVRFLAYFVAALQTIEANIGASTLGTLQSPHLPPLEGVLAALINEIAALPGPSDHEGHPYILVLDDYHLITAQPIHDVITFLLDHLPPNLHLAIATRADPPLPLARLRARGQLIELRQTDLRFTPKEAAALLNNIMRLGLSPNDVAALEARTEGWIVGLQLAAISMQGREDISGFIRAFTGSHRYILDYLAEEVFGRQPPAIQEFLLKTSVLERLTGPLCDVVLGARETGRWVDWETGRLGQDQLANLPTYQPTDSQATLEYLERANLFIVPLDDERRWYRYHRLFADLLGRRLHQIYPDLAPTLHRRASEWHEQQGLMAAAVEHALAAKAFERAASLIEGAAEATMMRSEFATLQRWLDRLPDEMVRVRPALCVYSAWALLMSGHPWSAVEARLEDAARYADVEAVSVWAAPLRAFVDIFRGQADRATELSRRALAQIPEGETFLRSLAAWTLATSYVSEGNVATGLQLLEDLGRKSHEAGNVLIAVMVLCNMAELSLRQGGLRQAQTLYQQALDQAIDAQGQRLPIAGMALIGLGELAREWNDLEAAECCFVEGIELSHRWGRIIALDGYVGLARLKQTLGDAAGADEEIRKAQALAVQFDATEVDDWMVDLVQARLWAIRAADDPRAMAAAQRWVEQRGIDDLSELTIPPERVPPMDQRIRKYELLVVARLRLIQRRHREALALLESILPLFERRDRVWMIIEVLILRALACQALGDAEQALASLAHALSLAEPEGYLRIFLDEGEPVARLLRRAMSHGIAPQYVRKLLMAFPGVEPALALPEQAADMEDPLSERELEVLRLLATGLSNPEIADELYIAVSTVRSHCKNIYSKLNVHRRWDAVRRAQELGLI
jgi:LuxR family maltose regulon positive regulatory protein